MMDSVDCLISEFDYKSLIPSSGFTSPGPSSGYCSSEENHTQLNTLHSRRADSFCNGTVDVTVGGLHQLDPYFGDLTVGGTGIEDDFKTGSLNFDDLMDTLWDPLRTDFSSSACDLTADVDMGDLNLSSSSSSSMVSYVPSNRSDPSLTRSIRVQTQGSGSSWQKRSASPTLESLGAAKKPSNSISAESQNRLKKVFDFQQQIAGLADMVVGDEEDYILRSVTSNNRVVNRAVQLTATQPPTSPTSASSSTTSTTHPQATALLGGVFGQRGTVPSSFKNCESKALSRFRGGTVATSCGTLLRHSVTAPNSLKAGDSVSSAISASRGTARAQNGTSSLTGSRSCSRGDMKGGRSSASTFALDDHRYTLREMQSPPATKQPRSRKSSSTTSNITASATPYSGKMSILEAFLRSTRSFDPNKGSNAALAAEGLAYMKIEGEANEPEQDRLSGTILKKLLTGEMDQSEVHLCEERVIQERGSVGDSSNIAVANPKLPIELPLTDGFGLVEGLALDESDPGNLLCDNVCVDWMNADTEEEGMCFELDEILREQTRQDNLWLQHYISECL